LTRREWRWSDFINNFVTRLLEELGKRGYLRKITHVGLRDQLKVLDQLGAEAQTVKGEPTEFYIEYEVKARLTLQALESIIYEITPYLDPDNYL